MRRDYERERSANKSHPYSNDQGQDRNYVSRKMRDNQSRRSSVVSDSISVDKFRSSSTPFKNGGFETYSKKIPVYGDDKVELGKGVTSFQDHLKNVRNINNSLKEK